MTDPAAVQEFLSFKKLALYGMSSRKKKFGNVIHGELKKKGFELYPIHPHARSLQGVPCWNGLSDLPEPVEGAVLVVPPPQTERIVRELVEAGVHRVWIQQGAESENALDFCRENRMSVVHGECILMFAEPVGSIHRVHRWLWKVLGKLPR